MFLFGIINSIFWALVLAALLWILCAFSGRLVNAGFRLSAVQHLICLAVAIPTVALLVVVFTCNKLNSVVTQVDNVIVKTLMADGRFVEQLQQQIEQTSTNGAERLNDYLAQNVAQNISSNYPMLGKYVDAGNLVDNLNIGDILQGVDAGKSMTKIVQGASEKFTSSIRSKIKSVRWKALIAVILLQAVAFSVVFYKAGKYHNPALSNYHFESND